MNKSKCSFNGCNNPAATHSTKNGKKYYRKLCEVHHKQKYGMPRHGVDGKEAFKNNKCSLCGWDKAPCDRHRIKCGSDGGRYEKGNVIIVCPNCHRAIHLKERTSIYSRGKYE